MLGGTALAQGACKHTRSVSGELAPPADAPDWESRFAAVFDDGYTQEPISLVGRAPHDVLDQRLFVSRLGHASLVALVRVDQVWARGRYQGRQDQYVDVTFEEVLLGDLPRKVDRRQLLPVRTEDELPGSLQGQKMLLFLRWAPGEEPPYHHHLLPATDDLVEWVRATVAQARKEGAINVEGKKSLRQRRRERRKARKAAAAGK